ncbi:MAG: hypothetical protein ABI685_11320 [Ferruginibacter sp.]
MADFSCYVQIVNKTNHPMNLNGAPVYKEGKYITSPPASIAPGATINFQIQQVNSSSPGPEGSCEYSVTDQHGRTGNITFSYTCLVKDTNATDAVMTGYAEVKIQMIPNPLPQYGHPVNVQFSILNKFHLA